MEISITEEYKKKAANLFRPKRLSLYSKESMDAFKKEYPQYKDMKHRDLIDILSGFNEYLFSKIIEHPEGFEFPQSTGYCFIGSCSAPVRKKNYDIRLSMEYNKWIRHRNFETDNNLAKIFYTNYPSKYKFKFSDLWKFKACRKFSRAVSKAYPERWTTYIKVDNYERISTLFGNEMRKEKSRNKKTKVSADYDEFKMD